MNCAEARLLLDRGITPGATPPERAALGFHLAGCAECRAYRAASEHDLLQSLLLQAHPAPAPKRPDSVHAPAPVSPQVAATPPRQRRKLRTVAAHAMWYIGLSALAALALLVVGTVGWALLTGMQIHRNVQAMIIPTVTPPPTFLPATATSLPPTTIIAPTSVPATFTPLPPTASPVPTALPATPTPNAPPARAPVTVLLLGSDQRPDETDPARTDAIIVARIDPQRQRVALLSLPRDLWVTIPGYGETRINAAHVWGEIYKDPAGGIGLAQKTVSNLLNIPIDYTVYINFQGFIGAIDALGGVPVDVEKELYDDHFPTMDYGYTVAHFLPGRQQMDGETALMYSRIRHPDSDFARMRRQQAVLIGVLTSLREHNVLQNLQQLEDVTSALRDYVKTDLPEERILGLTWALRNVQMTQIEHYFLDVDMITFGVGDDRWAEVAQPDALEQLAQQLLGE